MLQPTETWSQRRERYLNNAAEAETAAFRCREEYVRESYVQIAKSWTALAYELGLAANDHIEMAFDRPIEAPQARD